MTSVAPATRRIYPTRAKGRPGTAAVTSPRAVSRTPPQSEAALAAKRRSAASTVAARARAAAAAKQAATIAKQAHIRADSIKFRPTTKAGRALKAARARAEREAAEKRRQKSERNAADANQVSRKLCVYWPDDDAFYPGTVVSYDKRSGKHLVRYNDGDEEWLKLRKERVKWISRVQTKSGVAKKNTFEGNKSVPGFKVPAANKTNMKVGSANNKRKAEHVSSGTNVRSGVKKLLAPAAPIPETATILGSVEQPKPKVEPKLKERKKRLKKKTTLQEVVTLVLQDAGDEGMNCREIAQAIEASGLYKMKCKTPYNSVFGAICREGAVGPIFRKVSPGYYALVSGMDEKNIVGDSRNRTMAVDGNSTILPPTLQQNQPTLSQGLDVRVLLIVVEGNDTSNDPGYVCVALVPCAVSSRSSENRIWGRRALNAGYVEGVGRWGVGKRRRLERGDPPVLQFVQHMKKLQELGRMFTAPRERKSQMHAKEGNEGDSEFTLFKDAAVKAGETGIVAPWLKEALQRYYLGWKRDVQPDIRDYFRPGQSPIALAEMHNNSVGHDNSPATVTTQKEGDESNVSKPELKFTPRSDSLKRCERCKRGKKGLPYCLKMGHISVDPVLMATVYKNAAASKRNKQAEKMHRAPNPSSKPRPSVLWMVPDPGMYTFPLGEEPLLQPRLNPYAKETFVRSGLPSKDRKKNRGKCTLENIDPWDLVPELTEGMKRLKVQYAPHIPGAPFTIGEDWSDLPGGWGQTQRRLQRRVGDRGRPRGWEALSWNIKVWKDKNAKLAEDHMRALIAWEKSSSFKEGSSSETRADLIQKPPEHQPQLPWPHQSFLPGVPIYGGLSFDDFPVWAHPHWPLGGIGVEPPMKKSRKLPRVWRGKDLDMIVFGRDERLEWARKTGMFLARARSALGDRRLHRNAWGGSVIDSVIGAMLTQNVSDVLSSSAIMNLAAKFPGKAQSASNGESIDMKETMTVQTADKDETSRETIDGCAAEDVTGGRIDCVADVASFGPLLGDTSPRSNIEDDGFSSPTSSPSKRLPARSLETLRSFPVTCPIVSQGLVTAANGAYKYFATNTRSIANLVTMPTEQLFPRIVVSALAPQILPMFGPPLPPPPPLPYHLHELPQFHLHYVTTLPRLLMPLLSDRPSCDPTATKSLGPALPPPLNNIDDDDNDLTLAQLLDTNIACSSGENHARPNMPEAPKNMKERKKTKEQIVREERAVAAAEALKIEDPSPRMARSLDLIDWKAVMNAPVEEVVDCIRCRGMHYMLAARIQGLLRRIHGERGCLSLEFLHNCPTELARGYLLSLEGFGVKTVSCILLLALYRADFPVDVNVGRIMARLGWVPLETEQALEELSEYAPEPAVYTFLRDRLNSFGLQTLFELHYHMITLGKVFCEKRTPNCVACPLRDMCEYAASGGKHQQPANATMAVAPEQDNKGGTGKRKESLGSERHVSWADRNERSPPSVTLASATEQIYSPTAPATPIPPTPAATAAPATTRETPTRVSHAAAVAAIKEILENSNAPTGGAVSLPPLEAADEALNAITTVGSAWHRAGRPPSGAAAVLGLDPGADWSSARAVHARLSRLIHPDKCRDPRADGAFALITAARNCLSPTMPLDDVLTPIEEFGGAMDDSIRIVDDEVIVGAEDDSACPKGQQKGIPGNDDDTNGKEVDIEDDPTTPEGMCAVAAAAATKGFAVAAAAAAASVIASPLQLQMRPPSLNLSKIRHELTAWSLPPSMVPSMLRDRAPDIDIDCYLAVENGLPSAVATAKSASSSRGENMIPLAILVPCRAAMFAKFPLHGTYFQTNEVFLDAETATRPELVPAHRLNHLPTVSVYLGSSVASICRGMSRAEVASSFANRAVCVRSWDPATGHPRPLPKWACPFMPRGATALSAPGEEEEPPSGMATGPYRHTPRADVGEHPLYKKQRQRNEELRRKRRLRQQMGLQSNSVLGEGRVRVNTMGRGAPPVNVEDDDEEGDVVNMDDDVDSSLIMEAAGVGAIHTQAPPMNEEEERDDIEGAVDNLATTEMSDEGHTELPPKQSQWSSRVLLAYAERRRLAAEAAREAAKAEKRDRRKAVRLEKQRLLRQESVSGSGSYRADANDDSGGSGGSGSGEVHARKKKKRNDLHGTVSIARYFPAA